MEVYRVGEVIAWLEECGCEFDGETVPAGLAFFDHSGVPFTVPHPLGGTLMIADIVDIALANRWIPIGNKRPMRLTLDWPANDQFMR